MGVQQISPFWVLLWVWDIFRLRVYNLLSAGVCFKWHLDVSGILWLVYFVMGWFICPGYFGGLDRGVPLFRSAFLLCSCSLIVG